MQSNEPTAFHEYFAGKKLSYDWTSHNFPVWERILEPRRKEAPRVLEIGSLEGRSALFFLNFLSRSTIVCIDPFSGSREHQDFFGWAGWKKYFWLRRTERRFDHNLAQFAGRVEKRRERSIDALARLGLEGRRFDLIYIDGSHDAIDVYRDCTLSWPLLESGGIMILDDYEWYQDLDWPDLQKPKLAIDRFLGVIAGQHRELHRGYQIVIAKS